VTLLAEPQHQPHTFRAVLIDQLHEDRTDDATFYRQCDQHQAVVFQRRVKFTKPQSTRVVMPRQRNHPPHSTFGFAVEPLEEMGFETTVVP
jgi:hypothetical protein